MRVVELYKESRRAIVQQPVPTSVQPLEWTFSTIVNGYNAHPVFSEMYEFTMAVSQGSLNHGRRVLLSIMCLLDCAGCNKTYMLTLHPNAVFGTCVSQEVVELLRQSFSEEDQEAFVQMDQLPPRLRSGVREQSLGVWGMDSALAQMLQDERTTMGQRTASARMLSTTPVVGSEDIVRYPLLGQSQRLTGEVPVDQTATVTAFMWLFALKSALNNIGSGIYSPPSGWTVRSLFL